MKKGKLLLFTAAAAAVGYKIAKETALIDKIVYKTEYENMRKYIKTHYSGCIYTNLEKTDMGFVSVVTVSDVEKVAITMAKASDGIYIFSEQRL